MSGSPDPVLAVVLSLGVLSIALAATYRPLGDLLARTYLTSRDLAVERAIYRVVGVAPRAEQTWRSYARAILALGLTGVLLLYVLQRVQALLPYALGLPAVDPAIAFNTAISFVTNTNWQSYAPEATMGYLVQAVGLTVQNFVSAAMGMAVAVALVRGFARRGTDTIGNAWVDVTRTVVRVLLPLSVIFAVVLLAAGVVQSWTSPTEITTLTGATQTIPGGPVASQEAIKLLGTNGGGFFNANSAHPMENPAPWTNLLQVYLMLAIPFALPRTFGRLIGDDRQGYAIAAVMGALFLASTALFAWFELSAAGTVPQLAGAAMEGKETRFGVIGSVLFGSTSTLTSTGAVNAMHDSTTALGGMMPLLNMMLGEVAPGGVGSGLYGMLVLAVLAVFLSGLMVGRTPEYLGKRLGRAEVTLASLYLLVTPVLVLGLTALSLAVPAARASVTDTSLLNTGPHGLTELLYAFTSAANNNGSAFAGLDASTPWLATTLGIAMLLGRFVPIVLVLALAGTLARQDKVPVTAGTLPTHRPLFVGLLATVVVILTALTYLPVLSLGPLAEGLA